MVDILRCELESAPRWIRFCVATASFRLCDLVRHSNEILVYAYDVCSGRLPEFELVQKVPTYLDNDESKRRPLPLWKISPERRLSLPFWQRERRLWESLRSITRPA
ncbi:MAG: hypothetical protein ACLR2E_03100 [Lachnospiraceae bacterium]